MVLETCYKTAYNMMARQNHEIETNQRLLEKQVRIENTHCLCFNRFTRK